MISLAMLPVLHNNTIMAKKTTRKYEDKYARDGAKIGNRFEVRKPPRLFPNDGITFVSQDYVEEMVELVVTEHKNIGIEFNDDDLTLNMDDFAGRVIAPSLVPIANQVDVFLASKFSGVWNTTGSPGTVAATDTPFLDAHVLLTNNDAPMTKPWPMLVTPRVGARLSSGLAGRFNPQPAISKLYEQGSMNHGYRSMGTALGWDFYETQNMPNQATGVFAGTPSIAGANQTGATINTDLWTATTSTVAVGDVVQFDGVFQVNPVTHNTIGGELMNFRITAAATADGGGLMALSIEPPIITSGRDQTCSGSPADDALVYVYGTTTVANVASKQSAQCLGWAEDAITLACVDLKPLPKNTGVECVRMSDDDLGLSIMFSRGSDIRALSLVSRFDILYGAVLTRPEHMVRVAS
jgi:coat protein Gp5